MVENYRKTTALEQMEQNGGSFVKGLAEAMRRADRKNFDILRKAFPEYMEDYQKMADIKNKQLEKEEEDVDFHREDLEDDREDNSNVPAGYDDEGNYTGGM